MTDLEKALDQLSKEISDYRKCNFMDGNKIVEHCKQITGILFYLEKVRSDAHKDFQATLNRLVLDGYSVARAENEAHVKHPEMYMLRRIMDGAYEVVNAIRSNLSWIKMEKNSN